LIGVARLSLANRRSRSESESEEGAQSRRSDPKPGELPLARVKVSESWLEARTLGKCKSLG